MYKSQILHKFPTFLYLFVSVIMILPLKTCFSVNKTSFFISMIDYTPPTKLSIRVQTKQKLFLAKFSLNFFVFSSFVQLFTPKMWKSIFRPAIGVCITQTLVIICNRGWWTTIHVVLKNIHLNVIGSEDVSWPTNWATNPFSANFKDSVQIKAFLYKKSISKSDNKKI